MTKQITRKRRGWILPLSEEENAEYDDGHEGDVLTGLYWGFGAVIAFWVAVWLFW